MQAVIELKFGPDGMFRGGARHSAWRRPDRVAETAQRPSSAAIDATVAYCEYVYRRYGRFLTYPPPFRTVLGYQAGHSRRRVLRPPLPPRSPERDPAPAHGTMARGELGSTSRDYATC